MARIPMSYEELLGMLRNSQVKLLDDRENNGMETNNNAPIASNNLTPNSFIVAKDDYISYLIHRRLQAKKKTRQQEFKILVIWVIKVIFITLFLLIVFYLFFALVIHLNSQTAYRTHMIIYH